MGKRKKRILIVLSVLIVLLLASAAAFFVVFDVGNWQKLDPGRLHGLDLLALRRGRRAHE